MQQGTRVEDRGPPVRVRPREGFLDRIRILHQHPSIAHDPHRAVDDRLPLAREVLGTAHAYAAHKHVLPFAIHEHGRDRRPPLQAQDVLHIHRFLTERCHELIAEEIPAHPAERDGMQAQPRGDHQTVPQSARFDREPFHDLMGLWSDRKRLDGHDEIGDDPADGDKCRR